MRFAVARLLFFSALLAALVGPATASAQSRAVLRRARALFNTGAHQFDRGHFQQALQAFSAAYDLAPNPIVIFNIAQCHLSLGHDEDAAANFRLFLAQAPESEQRPQVERWLRQIAARQAMARHEQRQEMLTDMQQERQRMERREPLETATDHQENEEAPAEAASSSEGGSVSLFTWITLGTGLAAAGAGTYFALDAAGRQSDLDNTSLDCRRAIARCVQLVNDGDRSAMLRTVLLSAGGAALLTGIVTLIVDLSSGPDHADTAQLSPIVAPGLAGLELHGTF